MKLKRIGLLLSVFFLSIGANAQSDATDYNETLEWIKGKMENFEHKAGSGGFVNNRWNYTDTYTYKVLTWSNCTVRIEETRRHVTQQSTSRNDYTSTRVVEFAFGDLKSITFSSESGSEGFTVKTYNDAKKIQIDPDGSTSVVNEFIFRASKLGELEGQSERFTKAWKHAMELCGAKEEKF